MYPLIYTNIIFTMKRNCITLLAIFAFMILSLDTNSQNLSEVPTFKRYAKENAELPAPAKNKKRIVFIGNSITEFWASTHPYFFENNGYIGRGISGQTSPQMLLRFYRDVVALKPTAVVINAGTNDIAENTGKYDADYTFDNIRAMADIAKSNKIKVILSSVLPAEKFVWNQRITDAPQKIEALNKRIKEYAKKNNYAYIDYYSTLKDEKCGLPAKLSSDGVHPNAACYEIMEKIAKKVIDKIN